MLPEPMSQQQFTRFCLTGLILFIGAATGLCFMALGATLTSHPQTGLKPDKICEARYLGEIAYWAEAPDNTMVCQRMDRNSMRERKCADADIGKIQ
jgi:hypothetical protein